jgi:hypothetical protein
MLSAKRDKRVAKWFFRLGSRGFYHFKYFLQHNQATCLLAAVCSVGATATVKMQTG